MENENNPQPENSRVSLIERYLLDPQKVIFELLSTYEADTKRIADALANVDLASLEKLQGQDGYNPQRGVDYMNDADIAAIEGFIADNLPIEDVHYPSISRVDRYINEKVAKIPRVKGDKGEKGDKGKDGKDGSADSGKDIIEKVRALPKNQGWKTKDIRGLDNRLKFVAEFYEEFEALKKAFTNLNITIPMPAGGSSGGVTSVNGQTGVVVLDADDIDDTSTTHKFVTAADLTKLSNLSGTNTGDVTVSDSAEIDFTLTGQQISATIVAGSIDESKLDTSVNNSLDLADSSLQPGDSITELNGTAWRVFYSNGSGDITELALGADGTFLKSNGATSAPSFATPAGSGDVSKVGTPVNNQIAVWTGDGTIEGDTALTFDTTTDILSTVGLNLSGLTASLIVATDASKNLVTLSASTYPTLVELAYVKGVTSAIQTQLNAKAPIASPTFTGTVSVPATNFTVGASIPFSDSAGTLTLQNIDALDATTESTIEAAIDTLANLVSIQGRTVTFTDAGADAIFGWDDSANAYENLTATEVRVAIGLATADTPVFAGANLSSGTATLGTVAGAIDAGGATSFEVPNGAGGTTVNATGEVTVDSTSRTFNFYDGTLEAVLNPIQSKSITIESPGATEDISMFFTDDAITIVKIVFSITGSTSVTTTIRHGTDRSAAGAEVVTGGTVANSTTTGNVVTSFNDATVPADSFIWLETTALSGTPTSLNVTIFYRQDA